MRFPLAQAAYEARSLIANAQRCVNLYPERNPPDAPFPLTHYLTPGLLAVGSQLGGQPVRGLYMASWGVLYAVIGNTFYSVFSDYSLTALGTVDTVAPIVVMKDNSLDLVIVSEPNGYIYNPKGILTVLTATAGINSTTTTGNYVMGNTTLTLSAGGLISVGDTVTVALDAGGVFTTTAAAGTTGTTLILSVGLPSAVTSPKAVQDTTKNSVISPSNLLLGTVGDRVVIAYDNGQTLTTTIASRTSLTWVLAAPLTSSASAGNEVLDTTTTFVQIGDAAWVGSTGVDYVDTYLVFNQPATRNMFISDSNRPTFFALNFAAKSGGNDLLVRAVCTHNEVWLIGADSTEVWYDAGAADFPFAKMPGAFINHGCVAKYSPQVVDLAVLWLGRDVQGRTVAFEGMGYVAKQVSTRAVENIWQAYGDVSDAIGIVYQQEGHYFYVLTFPSADATWVFDLTERLWHERDHIDANGLSHRWAPQCLANAYGDIVAGDTNGQLYEVDLATYTDNGAPIRRLRSWPHLVSDNRRVNYKKFIADMEIGDDPATDPIPPVVYLAWSNDKGKTFGNPVGQSLGALGNYLNNLQWWRTGMARDRVYELSWAINAQTALNGAYVEVEEAET